MCVCICKSKCIDKQKTALHVYIYIILYRYRYTEGIQYTLGIAAGSVQDNDLLTTSCLHVPSHTTKHMEAQSDTTKTTVLCGLKGDHHNVDEGNLAQP